MKFQFMEMHQETHGVGKMAKIFNVSRSGYYAWCLRRRREQNEEGNDLGDLISSIQSDLRYTYGAKRMTAELKRRGYEVNHKRVARIMRENGLQVRRKKRFRSTTNSEHDNPVAENVLDRQFEVETPDTAYVSDITYVPTAEGWMYLCIILDLASRKIVGWSISARMTADLVIDAVGSGNSGRPISGKSVRFGEEMNSDRLVADQCNEGKDDTNADTTRDPGIAERRPHPEGDR
jgi:putative transposase